MRQERDKGETKERQRRDKGETNENLKSKKFLINIVFSTYFLQIFFKTL